MIIYKFRSMINEYKLVQISEYTRISTTINYTKKQPLSLSVCLYSYFTGPCWKVKRSSSVGLHYKCNKVISSVMFYKYDTSIAIVELSEL
jgi:hypothetical protein